MLQIMASYLFNADKFKSFIKKNKIKDEDDLIVIVNNIGEKGEFNFARGYRESYTKTKRKRTMENKALKEKLFG